MNYWLDLFTGVSWDEFRKAGSNVTGFRESRWNTLQKIKNGDIFLCYLTGVSRFVGLLQVTGKPFEQLMRDEVFKPLGMTSADYSQAPGAGEPFGHVAMCFWSL